MLLTGSSLVKIHFNIDTTCSFRLGNRLLPFYLTSIHMPSKSSYMKLRILIALSVYLLLLSCKKDTPVEQPFRDLLTSVSSWKISHFVTSPDSSINYTGYVLEFRTDGTMVINSDTSSGIGTWRVYSYDRQSLLYLVMEMEGHEFMYLSGNHWNVISQTPTEIDLRSGRFDVVFLSLIKNS